MKTEGKVRQQLKQVAFRHLKREIESSQKRVSQNCVFNTEGATPGYPSQCRHYSRQFKVCDSSVNPSVCQKCDLFVLKLTPEIVKEDFRQLMAEEKSIIAEKYPDIAALRWVLEEEVPEDLTEEVEPTAPPKRSFWKSLVWWRK